MLITSADQIAAPESSTIRIDVPEWGEGNYVLIGRLTGLQYQQYVDYVSKESSYGVVKSRHAALIAACMRDENGKPVMAPNLSEPLAKYDAATLLRLFYICQKHNHIDDESFEDLKKNYAATHSNGSATASPAT